MPDLPVVIAGAGIAGLSAALALASVGRRSIVLERAGELSEFGAGVQLAPNATRRLRKWDALAPLAALGMTPEAVEIFSGETGRLIVEIPVREAQARWGAPYLFAHRADLLKTLADCAARSPLIELAPGREVEGWSEADDRVVVHAAGGANVVGAALVGADGVRSRVRAGLRLVDPDKPLYARRTAWRTLVPAERVDPKFLRPRGALRLSGGAHLVHYPLRGASVVNVVAITEDEWTEPDNLDFWSTEGDGAFLADRFADWSADARALIAAAPGWRRWPLFMRRPLGRWGRGRVSLAGDAAHAMPPFLAQGAAQAIEDADALAGAFARLKHPAAALRAYEIARVPRANRVQALSIRQGRIYHFDGPLAAARDLSMRLLGPAGMARAADWLYRA